MKTLKSILAPFLTIVAVVLALNSFGMLRTPEAKAQTVPGVPLGGSSSGTGAGNPWDGRGEQIMTWTGTLSTTSVGVICTNVTVNSTATRCSIKCISITCATAQYVDIYDGSTITNLPGSSCLIHVYCASNVATVISRDFLGTGLTGSIGNNLSILGSNTGACYISYAVQRPTS